MVEADKVQRVLLARQAAGGQQAGEVACRLQQGSGSYAALPAPASAAVGLLAALTGVQLDAGVLQHGREARMDDAGFSGLNQDV